MKQATRKNKSNRKKSQNAGASFRLEANRWTNVHQPELIRRISNRDKLLAIVLLQVEIHAVLKQVDDLLELERSQQISRTKPTTSHERNKKKVK